MSAPATTADLVAALADAGVATTYEAAGRRGLVDADLIPLLPGVRVAGRARTALCGQDDNLMVHAAMAELRAGEVLVITMPEPRPIGVVGDLLATQALGRGAAGLLIDAAVRDVTDLRALGLPIWSRWVRCRGATKDQVGTVNEPVEVGGCPIATGDVVVLDDDGAACVPADRLADVAAAVDARLAKEATKRAKLRAGALSYELDGLRAVVEAPRGRTA